MPYTQMVENFNRKYGVAVDSTNISNYAKRILTAYSDNRERDAKMKEYIKSQYPELAERYQIRRNQEMLSNKAAFDLTEAKAFFDGYVEIVNEITKDTASKVKEESERALEEARRELEEAKAKEIEVKKVFEEAKKLYDDAEAKKLPQAGKLRADAVKKSEDAKKAEDERKSKAGKEESMFRYVPYESTMETFGLSTKEVDDMLTEQVNSYTYLDARKFQLKTFGVTNPMFRNELGDAFGKNVLYSAASAEDKAKMHESFITKQLIEARLNSKGFFWKLFHPTETRTMREYIAEANKALADAKFPAEAEALATAMAEKGLGADSVEMEAIKANIKAQFAANDAKIKDLEELDKKQAAEREARKQAKLEEERKAKEAKEKEEEAKREKQLEEERIKKEAAKEELDAMNDEKYADRFFDKNFVPSMDKEVALAQYKLINRIGREYLQGNNTLDKAAKRVFEANFSKLKATKNAFENGLSLDDLPKVFESIDMKYAESTKNYNNPVTFADVKATKVEKEAISIDLGEDKVSKQVEPPKKETKLEKNAASKNV